MRYHQFHILLSVRLAGLLAIFLPLYLAGQEAVNSEVEAQSTVITSLRLEMQGTPEKNYFYFSGNVEVQGTNLEISCEELTVVALREGPQGATIGNIGAIEEIIASGNVEIHQAGRSAYAGRAEVNPAEGTVTLKESPRIVDDEVEVQGYEFVLHKGERKFESIPDPNAPAATPSRSVVRLGAMPDLGFDQEEAAITVDDQIQEAAAAELESVPSGEGLENEEEGDNDGATP